jgi:prepilin-type N-terminal cleavage/methylation domain-containing protein
MRLPRAFTLIEMLVVVGIVCILAGLLIAVLGTTWKHAKVENTRQTIDHIKAVLLLYSEKYNDFPPSDGDVSGLAGAENLYDCLKSKEYRSLLRDIPTCALPSGNVAFADAWSHPLRYIHHKDYDNKPPNKLDYRLISAGPNGQFENGAPESDDIGNW